MRRFLSYLHLDHLHQKTKVQAIKKEPKRLKKVQTAHEKKYANPLLKLAAKTGFIKNIAQT